jgi:DNA-binding LacI/PurR family transcriptional regulator
VLAGTVGDRLPGDRDFAREIGTSKITIGHILQELQAEGLVERIPGKGTFLRDRARSSAHEPLASARGEEAALPDAKPRPQGVQPYVMIVAVLNVPWMVQPLADDWSQRVALSVEQQLQRRGARTMVRSRHGVEGADIEKMVTSGLRAGVNHILHIAGPLPHPERSAMWENMMLRAANGAYGAPVPVVQIVFNPKIHLPFNLVAFDGETGSQMATQHLIDLGHRNIVFAGPSAEIPESQRDWAVDRVRGFRRALQLAGIESPLLLEEADAVMDSPRLLRGKLSSGDMDRWDYTGRSVARRILADPSITAVVAANDSVAAAIIDEVRKAGKRVPEDLSIVGYDNYYMSAGLDLTTVHVPVEQMGEAATTMLLDPATAKPGRKTQVILDPMLVVRGSTVAPSA